MTNETSYSPLMSKEEPPEGNKTITVVIGGLFLISANKNSDLEETDNSDIPTTTTEENFSTSTDLDSIDTDLQSLEETINNTGLDQLDQEIANLE